MQEIEPTHKSDDDDEDEIEPLIELVIVDSEYEKCHKYRYHHRESKYSNSGIIDRESCYITILYILNPPSVHRPENDLDKVNNRVCHPENWDDDSELEIVHIWSVLFFLYLQNQ